MPSRISTKIAKGVAFLSTGLRGFEAVVVPGTKVFLPTRLRHRFWVGVHPDSDLISFVTQSLHGPATFFDVGANIGIYSVAVSKQCSPELMVHAFEPCLTTIYELCRMLKLNGVTNVITVPVALSDHPGDLRLSSYPHGLNNFLLTTFNDIHPSALVSATTIDSYCSTAGVVPDAIKIDVEGHEFQVLSGASHTLRARKPLLVVECHGSVWPSSDHGLRIIRLLEEHGYTEFRLRDGRQFPRSSINQTVHLLATG